jgi:hypothetical protein
MPLGDATRFLGKLHYLLAAVTAEMLRRRQELLSALGGNAALPVVTVNSRPCPLPPERQLSVADLRQLEVQRRAVQALPAAVMPPASSSAPPGGEARRSWLQSRLIRVIVDDTIVCDVAVGSIGPCLLELFERITGEPFTVVPGALLAARVRALSRVMTTLMRREGLFDPPLQQSQRVLRTGSYSCWSR